MHIKEAFDSIAGRYDSQRRKLIPCYDDFYRVMTELVQVPFVQPKILDIGAGTGLLSQFLMRKFPDAEFTLVDISEDMLSIAKKRFEGAGNIRYLTADYSKYEFREKYAAVVSSLSIHHLNNQDKEKLYLKVYHCLENQGVFVNGDQFQSDFNANENFIQKLWKQKIESVDLTREEKDGAYVRISLDKTATIAQNIQWLKSTGFENAELFYRYFNFGVLAGWKNPII